MTPNQAEIEQKIRDNFQHLESLSLTISGNNLHIDIVSQDFAGMSSLHKQKKIYAALNQWLQSGAIHAVTMNTRESES